MVKKTGESVNIELQNNKEFTIVKDGPGMFSHKGSNLGETNIKIKAEKKKNARELIFDEIKDFVQKPNKKLEKQLQDKCADLNINFAQMLSKAKETVMKEKNTQKLKNPANLDIKM